MKTTLQAHRPQPTTYVPSRQTGDKVLANGRSELALAVRQSPKVAQQKASFAELTDSPRAIAQRKQLAEMFTTTVQRKGPQEEELLQGQFETLQKQKPVEEELLQGQFETVQKKGPEEDELLQGKFASTAQLEEKPAPNHTGLPDNLKSGIESLSGMSMDKVKVHYNSSQPAQLNALAYAQGTDIHVAPGQEQHLPHEAWHVVQQAQGRVQPTMQMKDGVPVNDDQGLEHEADVMGAKAVQMKEKTLNARPEYSAIQLHDGPGFTMGHGSGCACPGCCGYSNRAQLKHGQEGRAVVQRETKVSIQDSKGVSKEGSSGNESSTRNYFSRWPKLDNEFQQVVKAHEMDELNDEGKKTGNTYSRNRFMCAEPHALALLLHHYDERIDHGLDENYLSGLKFPKLAIDLKTQKSIPPCPVCSQWVTSDAPMSVYALGAVPMKNKTEFDFEKEQKQKKFELELKAKEEEKEKSRKKEEHNQQKEASDQKVKTLSFLQKSLDPENLYELIKSYFPVRFFGKKAKKPCKEAIKMATDDLLSGWINSLTWTNPSVIKLYENFDEGHEKEFTEWVSENPPTNE